MIEFLRFLRSNVDAWWSFMLSTEVPQCGFSFAELFLFVAFINIVIIIMRTILFRSSSAEGDK